MRKSFLCTHVLLCLILKILLLIPCSIVTAQVASVNLSMIAVNSSSFPKVRATFSVSDPQGFPITGLESDSFTISEDSIPISNYSITPINNAESPLAIVLVIDVSGSMRNSLTGSIKAAKEFIGTLGPNDQVALISFNETPMLVQDLTTDRSLLTQGLDKLTAVGDSALFDSLIEAIALLKPRTERKAVVVITDGYETGRSTYSFNQVIDEASRWSTHFYPIGIGGVNLSNLEKLAKLSGGFAQINPDSDAISEAFGNILSNLRNQYLLEYDSLLQADGNEHEVFISYSYPEGITSDKHRFIAYPGNVLISFSDLLDGQEVSGNVLLAPNIVSPGSILKLDIEIDQLLLITVVSPPFEYLWDSKLLETGQHQLSFTVLDSAGNSATQKLNLVVVPPVRVATNLSPDQPVSGKINILVDVQAMRGISDVVLEVDGVKLAEDLEAPFEFEWDTSKVEPGYHDVQIKVTDLEQNIGESKTRVIVEIQKGSNLIWIAVIILLIAAGIIIPLASRKNRNKRQTKRQVIPIETGKTKIATLTETEGLNPGQVWQLDKSEIRLGRKLDENDIPLKGLSASRFHAQIIIVPEGYLIQAVHQENPIIINGQTFEDGILLKHGDIVKAGESEFWFKE